MHALCWARPHRHYFHPKGMNVIYSLPKIKNSLVKEHVALLVTFSMLGKLAITSSYGTVYIFSAELFPTVVRNVGMGTASLSARIGGILCPYINMLRWNRIIRISLTSELISTLFSDSWTPLPLIIYGVLAFTA